MNIKRAKEQIKNAITAYFTKDAFGNYFIPLEKQRPVFLMGPPGIGKTAVMEQVAQELGVALVSYSMTHHTRQSALGLPFIVHKNYEGLECDVSEYTMSEIIASVYDMMERTKMKEGILFLDEINCVSETLAPIMLQFLQYKVFGRHRVPEGWIVVTAGNPPEYNNSVREFDIVTWDRLKRIDVEPDYEVWKEYAYQKGVHPSIITYLEIRKMDFYQVENSTYGKQFVTARGWEDLSVMIQLYEKHEIVVDEDLIGQYLQNKKVAKEFAIYYDLFKKYQSDYQVDKILMGKTPRDVLERSQNAKFDERLALLGLLLDAILAELKATIEFEVYLTSLMESLKSVRTKMANSKISAMVALENEIEEVNQNIEARRGAGNLSLEDKNAGLTLIHTLEDGCREIKDIEDKEKAFRVLKNIFETKKRELKKQSEEAGKKLSNVFHFCEEAFGDGQELLILVTELTISYHGAKFISRYGCKEYFNHNKELLFYERQREIIAELETLGWDE